MKLYFEESNEELCFPKEHYYKGAILFEAKTVRNIDMFFCKLYITVGEKRYCGKVCINYAPKNHKNGICIHHGFLYEKTNKMIIKK